MKPIKKRSLLLVVFILFISISPILAEEEKRETELYSYETKTLMDAELSSLKDEADLNDMELEQYIEQVFAKEFDDPSVGDGVLILDEQGDALFFSSPFGNLHRIYSLEPQTTDTDESEGKEITPGMYKVGTDLAPGVYIMIANNEYFEISADSSGNSILENGFVVGRDYIELYEGEYFTFNRGSLYALSDAPEYNITSNPVHGAFRVGVDIDAGEYRVSGNDAYYEVTNGPISSSSSIVTNGFITNTGYISVYEGQILRFTNLELHLFD